MVGTVHGLVVATIDETRISFLLGRSLVMALGIGGVLIGVVMHRVIWPIAVTGFSLSNRISGPLVVVVDVGSAVVGTIVSSVRRLGFGLMLSGPLVETVVGVVVGVVVNIVTTTWVRLSLLHLRSGSGSHQEHKRLYYICTYVYILCMLVCIYAYICI